jgi:hypothetical protein
VGRDLDQTAWALTGILKGKMYVNLGNWLVEAGNHCKMAGAGAIEWLIQVRGNANLL